MEITLYFEWADPPWQSYMRDGPTIIHSTPPRGAREKMARSAPALESAAESAGFSGGSGLFPSRLRPGKANPDVESGGEKGSEAPGSQGR